MVYTICRESGLLATDNCPEEETEKVIYFVIDPEDADGYDTDDTANVLPQELINTYCTEHRKEDAESTEKDPFQLEESSENTEESTEESSSDE